MQSGHRTTALVALSFALLACGKSHAVAATARGSAVTDSTAPLSSGIRDYVITASDYAYAGLPLHAPSGWLTLRLANAGSEMHMLGVFPVPSGYTPEAFVDSLVHMHLPKDAVSWAGVNNVSPGDTGTVSVFFPPGQYAAACFVRSADGTYHVAKGMAGQFDVVSARDTGAVGKDDALVTLTDNSVKMSAASLRSGARNIRVISNSEPGADLAILKLLPGRSAQQGLKWLANPVIMAPAAEALGGPSGARAGQRVVTTVDFTPGIYLVLLQPYTAKPHSAPMYRTLTIRSR